MLDSCCGSRAEMDENLTQLHHEDGTPIDPNTQISRKGTTAAKYVGYINDDEERYQLEHAAPTRNCSSTARRIKGERIKGRGFKPFMPGHVPEKKQRSYVQWLMGH